MNRTEIELGDEIHIRKDRKDLDYARYMLQKIKNTYVDVPNKKTPRSLCTLYQIFYTILYEKG